MAAADRRPPGPARAGAPAQGETYADLAVEFGIGTTTAFRYIHEALHVAPPLRDAVAVSTRRGVPDHRRDPCCGSIGSGWFRVATARYFSGKHKGHGVSVQVLADPAGRLIWASPALPGARHDMGAAREHGILDALTVAGVRVIADNGSGSEVPSDADPPTETGEGRRPSRNQKAVNSARARQRGPGEPATTQLKSWRILRKIRCCPHRATDLVQAVFVLVHAG